MISSSSFDFVNLLDKAADTSWKRETVISNNIANADTPTYKRKDIDFAESLRKEIVKYAKANYDGTEKSTNVGNIIKNMDMASVNPQVYSELENLSYRIDKNNVDIDTENVELASEQLRYQMLTSAMSQEFSRFRSVLSR